MADPEPTPTPAPTPSSTPAPATPETTPPAAAGGVTTPDTAGQSTTAVTNNPEKLAKITGVEAGLNDKFSKFLYSYSEKLNNNSFLKFNDKDNMKISIFVVNKFLYSENKDVNFDWIEESQSRNIIELLYNKDVEQITLEDNLGDIGISGSMVLRCETSRFQGFLENYMQYDLIIGITMCDETGNKVSIEPYIFNILKIKQTSKTSDQNRKFTIYFTDMLSYIAMTHSFASIRKLSGAALTTAQNYETLYNIIYDYLISFIQRFTLGTFTYKKVNFLENSDIDVSELVKMTVNKIGQNATVYDALKLIQYDACTAIAINDKRFNSVKKEFELFENNESALVPLFFKDEYIFHSAPYIAQFGKNDNITDKLNDDSINNLESDDGIIKRSLVKRNFSMPFYFAFGSDQKLLFESLNPDVKESTGEIIDDGYRYILGHRICPITRMTTEFIDMTINNARWKNMIFLFENSEKGDGNYLLRFNWLYNFYNSVLLGQYGNTRNIFSGILPDFYINEVIGTALSKLKKDKTTPNAADKKTGEAALKPGDGGSTESPNTDAADSAKPTAGTDAQTTPSSKPEASTTTESNGGDETNKVADIDLTSNDFHEYNANTFLIMSEDETKEIQYHIGKMLASFVLLNTAYTYNIEGSLFRRPNEIVKINRRVDNINISYVDPNSVAPSILNGKATNMMVYVTAVKHIFNGTSYINVINANKIYDSIQ